MVDASDIGAGVVLMQSDDKDIDHPICYFSCKSDSHQKSYSIIEKEALALLLAHNILIFIQVLHCSQSHTSLIVIL